MADDPEQVAALEAMMGELTAKYERATEEAAVHLADLHDEREICDLERWVRRADAQAAEIRKFTTTITGLMATSEGASRANADRVLAALRGER